MRRWKRCCRCWPTWSAPRRAARQRGRPFRHRPGRKEDPGELFDWELLAAHRLALASAGDCAFSFENDGAFFLALERFGYDISDQQAACAPSSGAGGPT
jgi:N-acetyl-anhydromuramyl-L-alanine amidase AmpD